MSAEGSFDFKAPAQRTTNLHGMSAPPWLAPRDSWIKQLSQSSPSVTSSGSGTNHSSPPHPPAQRGPGIWERTLSPRLAHPAGQRLPRAQPWGSGLALWRPQWEGTGPALLPRTGLCPSSATRPPPRHQARETQGAGLPRD